MGFFKKKETVDVEAKCRTLYKEANQLVQQGQNEGDPVICLSLWELASTKYQDILELIAQGANFEGDIIESLKNKVDSDIEKYKALL